MRSSRRRRRGGNGEEVSPPSWLGGLGPLGERNRFLVHFNLERTHLTTRYLVFSDITCVDRKWQKKIMRYWDRRQTAKQKVSTICIFPGFCKCSFCLVTCTCHITASLYFYFYCLWGITWWWWWCSLVSRLWWWCAKLQILVSCNCQNCPIWTYSTIFYYRFLLNFVWNNRLLLQFI